MSKYAPKCYIIILNQSGITKDVQQTYSPRNSQAFEAP